MQKVVAFWCKRGYTVYSKKLNSTEGYTMQYCNIFSNCVQVTDANYALLTAEQKTTLTQAEKCFIVQFLADTLASLTTINCESIAVKEDYVMRLCDANEVMQNLQMLYDTFEDDDARLTFTIEQAGAALCSYDTEYRDCITEQFEDECDNNAKLVKRTFNTNADYSTLALRVFMAY